jgi:hypothetical protein
MIFNSVDLPEPLVPSTPIFAPGKKLSEMSLRICRFGGTILPTRFMVKTYWAMENFRKIGQGECQPHLAAEVGGLSPLRLLWLSLSGLSSQTRGEASYGGGKQADVAAQLAASHNFMQRSLTFREGSSLGMNGTKKAGQVSLGQVGVDALAKVVPAGHADLGAVGGGISTRR